METIKNKKKSELLKLTKEQLISILSNKRKKRKKRFIVRSVTNITISRVRQGILEPNTQTKRGDQTASNDKRKQR